MAERKATILEYVFDKFEIDAAMELLDRRDRLEKSLLCILRKAPNGYYNAFNNISRGTRLIYVHAYQSYVWNKSVTERFKQYGPTKVLVGDLAVPKDLAHLVKDDLTEEEDEANVDPEIHQWDEQE